MRQPLQVPPSMNRWFNFADRLDSVAFIADLANEFTRSDKDTDHRLRVAALASQLAGVLALPASGNIILWEDFSNGSATDGNPATWHVPPQITVEDQSMIIRQNGIAFSKLTDSEFQNS